MVKYICETCNGVFDAEDKAKKHEAMPINPIRLERWGLYRRNGQSDFNKDFVFMAIGESGIDSNHKRLYNISKFIFNEGYRPFSSLSGFLVDWAKEISEEDFEEIKNKISGDFFKGKSFTFSIDDLVRGKIITEQPSTP